MSDHAQPPRQARDSVQPHSRQKRRSQNGQKHFPRSRLICQRMTTLRQLLHLSIAPFASEKVDGHLTLTRRVPACRRSSRVVFFVGEPEAN